MAWSRKDCLSVVQLEQDVALCAQRFPALICRPIAAQFMAGDLFALFQFEVGDRAQVAVERHYRLVVPQELTDEELRTYRTRGLG